MADEELSPDEEDLDDKNGLEEDSGSGKKKFILIGALALLLIGGGGAGVYFSGILNEPEEVATSEEPTPPPVRMIFYNLPEILTNLNDGERTSSVLKARVILELIDGADLDRLDQYLPRIMDILQTYTRELRIDDLRGYQGMIILRQELLTRINEAVKPVEVSNVLFSEILIQ